MRRKRAGLLLQVMILFTIAILITAAVTFYSQRRAADQEVRRDTEAAGEATASEIIQAVREYPASDWLIRYWVAHCAEMDIPYDEDFGSGTRTEEKTRLLAEHQPGLQLRYADEETLAALPPEDQLLAAEVAYSWLITRVNQIQKAGGVDYVFCVLTEEPFMTQFFLFSANAEGKKRGSKYLDVYELGKVVDLSDNLSQHEAMLDAYQNDAHLAGQNGYVDYYAKLGEIDGRIIMVGLTYDLTEINRIVRNQSVRGILNATAYQVLLSLICVTMVSLFIIRPLRRMQQSIRRYTETKDSETLTGSLAASRPRNEIGELSDDVSAMAREIDDHVRRIAAITAEHERAEAEISLAARIQANMLPSEFPAFPERTDFDICAAMSPAKDVGGDFYDFFLIDEDHLGLVIADVSGKGIPAALFMMAMMIVFHNDALSGMSPAEVLRKANHEISRNNREQMFVTVWLGVLDLRTGVLTAANAGHEYPVLRRPGGAYELLKDPHGFVVGGIDNIRYRDYTIDITPGSSIFVYTDGVPEATNAAEELFGTERMLRALNEASDASPGDALRRVREAVDRFVGDAPQFDDLTMLCLTYKGKGEPS